jgi:hypothetical protein
MKEEKEIERKERKMKMRTKSLMYSSKVFFKVNDSVVEKKSKFSHC